MTKALWASFVQLFDDYGDVLNGGTIESYAGGTTTPLATYTDSTGGVTNANPIVLNAAGRDTGGIWITSGVAYKFILKDANAITIDTIDNVVVGEIAGSSTSTYEVKLTYTGTPGAQAWMGGDEIVRSVTFPVNLVGSNGAVITAPGANYVISVRKNGTEVGTVTFDTSGVPTFATTGGATVSCVNGDALDFYAPDTAGTAANFKITLVGDL
jgi:hypothetical protein